MAVALLWAAPASLQNLNAQGADDPRGPAFTATVSDHNGSGPRLGDEPADAQADAEARARLLSEASVEGQIKRLAEQLRVLEAQRDTLLTNLTPRHPQVVEIGIQIDDINRRLVGLQAAARAAERAPQRELAKRQVPTTPPIPQAEAGESAPESNAQQAPQQKLIEWPPASEPADKSTTTSEETRSAEASGEPAIADSEPAVSDPGPDESAAEPGGHLPEETDDEAPGQEHAAPESPVVEPDTADSALDAVQEAPRGSQPWDPDFPPPPEAESTPGQEAATETDQDGFAVPPEAGPGKSYEVRPEETCLVGTVIGDSSAEQSAAPSHELAAAPPRSERAPSAHPSQPFALAALVVALVVAAVAAVLLARANGEAVFISVEEVGTLLSLPIVAVISQREAPAAAEPPPGNRWRALWLVVQILVAIGVFVVVAYAVQTPGLLSEVIRDPTEALARVAHLVNRK